MFWNTDSIHSFILQEKGHHMSIPVFELGNTVIKILVRCKFQGDSRNNITDVATTLYKMGVNEIEARTISRKIDEVGDLLAASCREILDRFGINDERRDCLLGLLIKAFNKAEISIDDFLDDFSTETLLYKRLINADKSYLNMLDPEEIEVYERILRHSSAFLYQAYMEMPEFQIHGIKRLNSKIDDVVHNIQIILNELKDLNNDSIFQNHITDFEKQYLRNIVARLNYIYLFGVTNMDRSLKKYKLSIAYVSLELSQNSEIFQLMDLMDKNQNLWIVGEAGAGKTTLLQWIAVQYAKNYSEQLVIPFYIELRNIPLNDFGIKKCIEGFMRDSSYEIPTGWIENKINSGNAIFLIDGFDEIPREDREIVFDRIEEIDPAGKCRKIYTSRPQITQRPNDHNLLELTILPMRNKTIKVFLEYWHKAVLEDQLQISGEDTKIIVQKLYSKIQSNASISKLASSPLLCAMLCALHYKNELSLPINKRELYEECCKLLIETRDVAKGLKKPVNLSYEQKKIVLSQFAYWMMMNNYSEVSKQEANYMIQQFLSSMVFVGSEISDYNQVFPYLLERSGLLREPEKNRIGFIHRSFEEYLAATEISRQNNWGYLSTMATNDMWKETVEIAIGYANSEIASRIIRSVLNKGKGRRGNRKNLLLACSYYNNAVQVDNKTSEDVKSNLEKMIPPRDSDVNTLVKTGELVIDFLKIEPLHKHEPDEFINPLKILRGIGTVRALETANTYLNYRLSPEEIKEYGLLIDGYTDKELKDYEVPKLIETYIYNYYSSNKTIHESMLRALLLVDDNTLYHIETKLGDSITIIGYSDKLDLSRIFRRNLVRKLSLYGHFESLIHLYTFRGIEQLVIYTSNRNFEFLANNKRQFMSLQSLEILLSSWNSISDLRSLFECKNLTLIKLNEQYHHEETLLLPSCSTLKIDGRYLNDVVFASQKTSKPIVEYLLDKELYHDCDIESYNGIQFKEIDEILAFHRERSGKLISEISCKHSKTELINNVSRYLQKPSNDVNRDLLHMWSEKRHKFKASKR